MNITRLFYCHHQSTPNLRILGLRAGRLVYSRDGVENHAPSPRSQTGWA